MVALPRVWTGVPWCSLARVMIWPPGGVGGLAREGQDAPLPGLAGEAVPQLVGLF